MLDMDQRQEKYYRHFEDNSQWHSTIVHGMHIAADEHSSKGRRGLLSFR